MNYPNKHNRGSVGILVIISIVIIIAATATFFLTRGGLNSGINVTQTDNLQTESEDGFLQYQNDDADLDLVSNDSRQGENTQTLTNDAPQQDLNNTVSSNDQGKIPQAQPTENVSGFSFKTNNPNIINPFTKELARNKNQISDALIKENNLEVFFKNHNEIILEKKRWQCCGGPQTNSLFIYANQSSDMITVVDFHSNFSFVNNPLKADLIRKLVAEFESERKSIMALQNPPGDIVSDGYYYAKLANWDLDKKAIKIDFVTVTEKDYNIAFDILMSNLYSITPTSQLSFENKLIRVRNFNISNTLYARLIGDSDKEKDFGNLYLEANANYLIKVKNGVIHEMTRINYAG